MTPICVERHIAAPPEVVFEVILDVDRYPEWNARGRPGIKSFRWQKCEPAPNGGTHFINYESFHGPLGPIVHFLFRKRLKAAFEKYCVALEQRTLDLAARRGSAQSDT